MTPVRVLAAGAMWRLFGARQSAETLFDAMSGDDEQNRMLAGISLVKAGKRSFDVIQEKIETGDATPRIIRLLPDIDAGAARGLLNEVADSDGELADTARDCLTSLDRIEAFNED